MGHTVTLIPGDSIGPEVAEAAKKVIAAAGVDIVWEEVVAGQTAVASGGVAIPPEVIASVEKNKVALKGKFSTPVGEGYESPNVVLRKELGLYAAVRPIKSQPGFPSRYEDVDLVIVREATEDVYSGIEHQVVAGVTQSIKITTKVACDRVVRLAFEYAKAHGRKKVTLVHKANIMKKSDGLFLRCGKEIAGDYPDIAFEALIADNMCMQLVKDPSRYEVVVAQNLFGDLISDLGAGVVGGISNVWGTMVGDRDIHVFECIHGIAPELVGKGVANPLPLLRAAIAMLRHLKEDAAADRIEAAVVAAAEAGDVTADLGGTSTTDEFVAALVSRLRG